VAPVADWPPGVAELVAEGFTPLEDVTGDLDIAGVWPEQHRRSVAETRAGWEDIGHGGRCWLVRSPWSAVPLSDVIRLLWSYVREATPDQHHRSGPATAQMARQRSAAVARFLSLDEEAVMAFRRAHADHNGTDSCP
jgi:hypothetical protein